MDRIAKKFAQSKKPKLITYIMAGENGAEELLLSLPDNGADIIELGIPFSDPTAEGKIIQNSAKQALDNGTKLKDVLILSSKFRNKYADIPLILMGYYNPIFHYGLADFANDAKTAGVDGLIIVDLPPEEEGEFLPYLEINNLALIRLIAPTTSDERLKKILQNAKGFIYAISVKGITGVKSADNSYINDRISHIKQYTDLPVAVGFGIKTPAQVKAIKADGIVVGSAIVEKLPNLKNAQNFVQELTNAI